MPGYIKLLKKCPEHFEEVLTMRLNYYTHNGITLSGPEWAKRIGISAQTFRWRIATFGLSERTFAEKGSHQGKKYKDGEKYHPQDRREQHLGDWDLENMQPRRSVHSLPEPGSWERENMPEENFHHNGGRSGTIEHDSDHYMGRTY